MSNEVRPSQLEQEIEQYASEYLPANPSEWVKRFEKDKIVHDSLWGTFSLKRHEVAVLDTPLIQRLRFLHQTGAVYLTYPSAHHTRFEHTLGVLCQSGRLCQSLRADEEEGRVDDAFERNVRMAALLHDTGHGPFSHTSEQFFSGLPSIEAFRNGHPELRESGAGEILSYLIVRSKAFAAFTDAINDQFKIALDTRRISEIITGTVPASLMYMTEIVHGPFDADKLDYMHRDGMFSGLKMHVDIDRLFHSIHIIKGKTGNESQTRIAGRLSGLSPLTQIMFNKMLLFTGMYHHHKVRAVDCMLWAIFQIVTEGKTKVGGQHLLSPIDFLRLTDDRLLVPELAEDPKVKGLIQDIRERRLWKKALVIARNTVPPSMHSEAGSNPMPLFPGVARLAGDEPAKIKIRREFATAIWEAAKKPCESHEVWLDVPKQPSMREAKEMWIAAPGEEPRILDEFIPVQQWVELYGHNQVKSHVFCPPEHTSTIAAAAKAVFKERLGLEFLPIATPK